MFLPTVNASPDLRLLSSSSPCNSIAPVSILVSRRLSLSEHHFSAKKLACFCVTKKPDPVSGSNTNSKSKRGKTQSPKDELPELEDEDEDHDEIGIPTIKPRKSRRGRRSEAAAVEDFMRDTLEKTFSSIRQQNSEGGMEGMENVLKEKVDEETDSDATDSDIDEEEEQSSDKKGKKMVVEEESSDWPLDADVGWGIRASEYFDQHPIKNIIGEDGWEIDWEGEIDDNWVNEINLLEWEDFVFHPSPIIVLVFERYNRASTNWKALKELEKAAKVYRSAKDHLPPRTVKIDVNIEKDLAWALKVGECPQILFLRGNRILHREKELRSADELVQMIAHFYYKAKKPAFMN